MDFDNFDNETLPLDRESNLPSVDNPGEANLEKDGAEEDLTVESSAAEASPEEWRSKKGEELLDAILDDVDRILFNQSTPHAEEGRTGVEASVKQRAQELREVGKGREAGLLMRAFRRLKKSAPETPTQRARRSSSSGGTS